MRQHFGFWKSAAAPPAWTPPSASVGTKLWWRADLGATVSGGLISNLVDQSGLADAGRDQVSALTNRPGYNVTDAAYGNQSVLTFSGTQRMVSGVFNAGVAAPVTLVFIGEITADSSALSDGSGSDMLFKSGGNAYFYGSAQGALPFGAATITVPCCIMFTDDGTGGGSAAKIYVNNLSTPIGTGATNWSSTTSLNLGLDVLAVGRLVGKIAEVIVFGGVLTAPDKANLVTYLNTTRAYGIGVT